jgi:hypothetical protein
LVSRVIVIVAVLVLPAASVAVTVIVFAPGASAIGVVDQEEVPDAVPELPVALLNQLTELTEVLSDAVPLSDVVDEPVE